MSDPKPAYLTRLRRYAEIMGSRFASDDARRTAEDINLALAEIDRLCAQAVALREVGDELADEVTALDNAENYPNSVVRTWMALNAPSPQEVRDER